MSETMSKRINDLMSQWNSLTIHHTTRAYQNSQARLLPFLAVPQAIRFDLFMQVCERRDWRWSTREAYWCAILAAQSLLGWPTTVLDKKSLGHLKHKSQVELARSAPPLLPSHLATLLQVRDIYSLAIATTFVLGQRASDVALWRAERIRPLDARFLAISIVEGKVVPRIGPYSLFLPIGHEIATALLHLVQLRRAEGACYIFPEDTVRVISLRLADLDAGLDVRSIRRGGLTQMALAGATVPQMLAFSRHASPQMLYKYLDHGSVVISDAENMCKTSGPLLAQLQC